MNYQKIYCAIIRTRKDLIPVGYTEVHHILPRSLGGDNSKKNLVRLTAREHFICHLLLTRIHKDSRVAYAKMLKAFMMMLNCREYKGTTSKVYAKERVEFSRHKSLEQAGEGNSQFGSKWVTHLETGEVRKLGKGKILPANYRLGKNRLTKNCQECATKFILMPFRSAVIFCSTRCSSQARSRQRVGRSLTSQTILLDDQGNVYQSVKECAAHYRKNVETVRLWVKLGKLLKLERNQDLTTETKEVLVLKIKASVRRHEESKKGLTEAGKDRIRLSNRTNQVRKAKLSEAIRNVRRARSLEENLIINNKTSETLKKYNQEKKAYT